MTHGQVLAQFGHALSDPTRARLLLALRDAPAHPAELADLLGVTRQNLSNHLVSLRGCGLVVAVPEGRRTRYEPDQLAGLCQQHAKTPLGLDDYRALFTNGGRLDTQAVDERAEEVKRLITLAASMCEAIRERSTEFGRLSARDLLLILAGKPVAEGPTEEELQALLDTLASPLLGVLHGSKSDGYRITTSAEVAQRRIEAVAQQLSVADRTPPAPTI